jgi:DNA invertase Pin-like site-specific DNA recombinase
MNHLKSHKHKAYSYSRFSSSKQNKGSSIERQTALFDQWLANSPDFEEGHIRAIDKATSAYSGKNKKAGLGSLLTLVKEGYIKAGSAIVIEALDRLSRESFDDAYETFRNIVKAGVLLITLEDNQVYDKSTSDSSSMYVLVAKLQAAHEYSDRLSKRVKAAVNLKLSKAKEGLAVKAPNRPYWIDADNKLNSNAEVALRLIELYLAGGGQRAVLRQLAAEFPNNKNIPADARSIKRILANEALMGHWRGVSCFPSLINVVKFNEIQEALSKRTIKSSAEEQYLLSGLIKCTECGSSFNFRRQSPRPTQTAPAGSKAYLDKGKIVYANCSNYLKGKTCSNSFTLPYEVAEMVFSWTGTGDLLGIAESIAHGRVTKAEIANLEAEFQMVEARFRRLQQICEIVGDADAEESLAKLKSAAEQRQVILVKLNAAKASEVLPRLTSKAEHDEWINGTPEQQELHKQTQQIIYELEANPVRLRSELRSIGYSIKAGRINGVNTLSVGSDTFRITKRSQKLGGYLVDCVQFDADGVQIVHQQLAKRKQIASA